MDIKPADLILVRGKGFVSETIENVTHSQYSHLAGLVKPNELVEAQGFRRTGYQALDYYAGQADVYTCDLLTDKERSLIVANVSKFIGIRYSYPLILWEWIRYKLGIVLPYYEPDPIVCSTLWMVEGYRSIGIDPCPGIRFPSPGDVTNSKLFRKVGSY